MQVEHALLDYTLLYRGKESEPPPGFRSIFVRFRFRIFFFPRQISTAVLLQFRVSQGNQRNSVSVDRALKIRWATYSGTSRSSEEKPIT